MSDDLKRDFYYLIHEHQSIMGSSTNYGSTTTTTTTQGFDSSSFMSFAECFHGSFDYNNSLTRVAAISPSSSEVFSTIIESNPNKHVVVRDLGSCGDGVVDGGGNGEIVVTPNSSVSCSSSGEEDSRKTTNRKESQPKRSESGGECSNKERKTKKKEEKRQREPRFAFMTKSEVDHLEDGYRWRKYGQKAVKNSPYPRSYYRCTTQKCGVKKRVERSFQDPSIVITTYEGKHNHPIPATLRGNAAIFSHNSSMLTPLMTRPTFPHDFLVHLPHLSNQVSSSSIYHPNVHNQQYLLHHHHHQVPDYGLLQDIVPSMFFKQEP